MSMMIKEAPISEKDMVAEAEKALADISRIRQGVGQVIFGQESVVERTLVALLAGGHALLVGVPGLAKTKLVETLGIVLGLDSRRIQFTPDLMPSDILGSEVMEQDEHGKRSFRFISGPDLRAAADGRRDQPRQPAHPVGAAAVDAGISRHRRRRRATTCPRPSMCWPRRTRSSRKAPIRCRRRSSTAS